MKLTEEERDSLVHNRVVRAFETWEETKGIIQNGYWYAASNRMYYACFYMTTALLMKHGYSASTHSGVIRLFGLYFVSTGIVDREIMMTGRLLKRKISFHYLIRWKISFNYLSVDSRVKK